MRPSSILITILATLLLGVACGGKAKTGDTTTGNETPAAWADMNHDQRRAYMKGTIVPAMKAAFQGFDGERFAEFNCGTCHGASVESGTFEMPNPDLPKLSMAEFGKLQEEKPEIMGFMMGTVVPEMAKMLGEQPYDPATGQGFGCLECHTAGE